MGTRKEPSATELALPKKGKPRGRSIKPGERLSPQTQFRAGPDPRRNAGGRPGGQGEFRRRCRAIAFRLVEMLESESFIYSTGDGGGGTDVSGMVRALEVVADKGGFLSADKQLAALLKIMESPALDAETRRRAVEEILGAEPAELPAKES